MTTKSKDQIRVDGQLLEVLTRGGLWAVRDGQGNVFTINPKRVEIEIVDVAPPFETDGDEDGDEDGDDDDEDDDED